MKKRTYDNRISCLMYIVFQSKLNLNLQKNITKTRKKSKTGILKRVQEFRKTRHLVD